MAENTNYHVVDLEQNEQLVDRIRALELQLSAELNQPIALIAYAPDDGNA